MATRMAGLPAYEFPQNALLNLNPINAAITDYRQREQQGVENARADEQLGMQRTRLGMEQARFAEDQNKRRVERIGNQMKVIDGITDPARRTAMWRSFSTANPDIVTGLRASGIDPDDHMMAPRFLMAEAGAYDPLGERAKLAGIARDEASTAKIRNEMVPETVRLLRAAGVDPTSEEGRRVIMGTANPTKTSLVPIYGTDAAGNPVVMQPDSSGRMVRSELPPGVTVSKQPLKMDAGTHYVLMDPVTRAVISTIPKDVAGVASAREVGEAHGKSVAALPGVVSTAEQTLGTIDQIRSHPGRNWGLGVMGAAPPVPGTAQAAFADLVEQAKGQAFLRAIDSLRGTGAITEIEGRTATQAVARLNRARRPEDFEAALRDFETIVRKGVETARQRAAPLPGAAGAAAAASLPSTGAPAATPTAPGGGRTLIWSPDGGLKPAGASASTPVPTAAAEAARPSGVGTIANPHGSPQQAGEGEFFTWRGRLFRRQGGSAVPVDDGGAR